MTLLRSKKRTGLNPLNYKGVEPLSPSGFFIYQRDPTTEDVNFNVGDLWLNNAQEYVNPSDPNSQYNTPLDPPLIDNLWVLVNITGHVATWQTFIDTVATLTGDSGGAVGPTATNIDLLGTAGLITTTGNPGTSTITFDIDGSIADTYQTDSGTAAAAANTLNVLGTSVLNTSGAGSTVSVNLTNGTNGQVIIGGGADPAWANIVSSDSTLTITDGANTINVGVTNGSNGEVFIGGGSNATLANITSTDGTVSITNGPGTIDIASTVDVTAIGFSAGNTSGVSNVTGDGTIYRPIADVEFFDNGGDYDNTTGVFTAPIDGFYLFSFQTFFLPDLGGSGGDECQMTMVTSADTYKGVNLPTHAKLTNFIGPNNNITYQQSLFIELTMGDTVYPTIMSQGGSKVDDIQSPAPGQNDTITFDGYFYFA